MASNPKEVIAALSSFGSIVPPPSVSKRSKASFISNISSSVSPGLSYDFGLNPLGTFLYFDAIIFINKK